MNNKRFTNIWCSETGEIRLTDDGVDLTFLGDSFEIFLNELNDENRALKSRLEHSIKLLQYEGYELGYDKALKMFVIE